MSRDNNSLEYSCEEVLMFICRHHPLLKDSVMIHSDGDDKATTDVFIFDGRKGAMSWEGIQPNIVEVTITFIQTETNERQIDIYLFALNDAIYHQEKYVKPGEVANLGLLCYLYLENETLNDRQDQKETRKNSMTVPLLAKLMIDLHAPLAQ